MTDISKQFQTPVEVCEYMAGLIPIPEAAYTGGCAKYLEPTPGEGNIVRAIEKIVGEKAKNLCTFNVHTPKNFFDLDPGKDRFDCIVMNPPFSAKSAHSIPKDRNLEGMRIGYHFLLECMQMSDHIIALMPWFTLLDSDVRMRHLTAWGLKSITALPRKTFSYARIQTCILELHKGYRGETKFKTFNF